MSTIFLLIARLFLHIQFAFQHYFSKFYCMSLSCSLQCLLNDTENAGLRDLFPRKKNIIHHSNFFTPLNDSACFCAFFYLSCNFRTNSTSKLISVKENVYTEVEES